MNFGEKLKDLRTQKGWSQENLAKKMGVTRRTFTGGSGRLRGRMSEYFWATARPSLVFLKSSIESSSFRYLAL